MEEERKAGQAAGEEKEGMGPLKRHVKDRIGKLGEDAARPQADEGGEGGGHPMVAGMLFIVIAVTLTAGMVGMAFDKIAARRAVAQVALADQVADKVAAHAAPHLDTVHGTGTAVPKGQALVVRIEGAGKGVDATGAVRAAKALVDRAEAAAVASGAGGDDIGRLPPSVWREEDGSYAATACSVVTVSASLPATVAATVMDTAIAFGCSASIASSASDGSDAGRLMAVGKAVEDALAVEKAARGEGASVVGIEVEHVGRDGTTGLWTASVRVTFEPPAVE